MVRIVGTTGTLWLDNDQIHIGDGRSSRVVPIAPDLELPPIPPVGNDPRHQTPKWQMLVPIELPPYLRLVEAFRARIEGREPPREPVIATFADGLASMEVLDAVRASAAAGGSLVRLG